MFSNKNTLKMSPSKNSNESIIWLLLDTVIIGGSILGQLFGPSNLIISALICYLIMRLFFSSLINNFAILIFLVPNLGSTFIYIGTTSIPILNLLICVALLKLCLTYFHDTVNKKVLLVASVFVLYEWIHIFFYDVKTLALLISWSAAVLYVFLLSIYCRSAYHHETVLKYFLAGVGISIVYGLLHFYNLYGTLLANNPTIRFKGAAGDSNYFAMYIMISMFSILYLINKKSSKWVQSIYPLLFLFYGAFGVLSLSRMFLLVVSFLMLVMVVKVFIGLRNNKKLFWFIIILLLLIASFFLYFSEEINSVFSLFLSRFTDFLEDPSGLTSNRNVIAERYFDFIVSDFFSMLVGIGIQEYYIRSGVFLETHNILLEILVVWGLVGFLIFGLFIATIFKIVAVERKISETSILGWLPIICMAVSYMSINAMSNESFFLLVFFAINHIYEFE
ncbi:O-antigen ligase family protein [Psychrobacillus psychrotolerans]|uniref:O-antigen ligase family protein n=1 Tax=Psychrobacillus psychrotolerans TaxID=126156 RepID=UPI003315A901